MKIILKNLKQAAHEVEIPSDAITVLELKQQIEAQHNFEAANLKLLFNGIVLDDSKTVSAYAIKDGNIVIMILTKGKVVMSKPSESVAQQPKETSLPKESTVNQPKATQKVKEKEVVAEKKPLEYTNEIKTLMEMGFSKEESGNAIRAAKGSVAIAVEFLYNGLPDQGGDDDNFVLPEDVEMNEENENERNDDNDDNDGHEEEGAGDSQDQNLKRIIGIVKVLYSQDPSNLEGILMNVQQNSPETLELIKDNQEEFQNMLKEPVTEEDMRYFLEFQNEGQEEEQQQPPQEKEGGNSGNDIQLTTEEYEAVKKIREMGAFDELETIQAYLAFDKNVELAANYLFENKANLYNIQQPISSQQQPPQQPKQEDANKDKDKENK